MKKASKAPRFKITNDGEAVRVYLPNADAHVKTAEWVMVEEFFGDDPGLARQKYTARGFLEVFPTAPVFESAKARAERIANEAGGYSSDRFSSWGAVAALLVRRGYSDREAVAIMVSKWTRWAADGDEAEYGRVPAKALGRYLDGQKGAPTRSGRASTTAAEVADLTRETFGDGAGPDWR